MRFVIIFLLMSSFAFAGTFNIYEIDGYNKVVPSELNVTKSKGYVYLKTLGYTDTVVISEKDYNNLMLSLSHTLSNINAIFSLRKTDVKIAEYNVVVYNNNTKVQIKTVMSMAFMLTLEYGYGVFLLIRYNDEGNVYWSPFVKFKDVK